MRRVLEVALVLAVVALRAASYRPAPPEPEADAFVVATCVYRGHDWGAILFEDGRVYVLKGGQRPDMSLPPRVDPLQLKALKETITAQGFFGLANGYTPEGSYCDDVIMTLKVDLEVRARKVYLGAPQRVHSPDLPRLLEIWSSVLRVMPREDSPLGWLPLSLGPSR